MDSLALLAHGAPPAWPFVVVAVGVLLGAGGILAGAAWAVRAIWRWLS